jgi:pectin methylesterase-like acyl-CoA thioesterase
MKLKRRSAISTSVAAAACAALALPAMASANTVWVSEATPEAPYNSCSHPGYNSIQQAIDGSATKIEVCTGNYQEQLAIEREVTIVGGTGVHVLLPATTERSTTACDGASEAGDGLEDQDLVSVCTTGRSRSATFTSPPYSQERPWVRANRAPTSTLVVLL